MAIEKLIERIENDRYSLNEWRHAEDRAYRMGWNAHAEHVVRLLRIELGLHELAASDVDGDPEEAAAREHLEALDRSRP